MINVVAAENSIRSIKKCWSCECQDEGFGLHRGVVLMGASKIRLDSLA
jgi:hypothetical protein